MFVTFSLGHCLKLNTIQLFVLIQILWIDYWVIFLRYRVICLFDENGLKNDDFLFIYVQ